MRSSSKSCSTSPSIHGRTTSIASPGLRSIFRSRRGGRWPENEPTMMTKERQYPSDVAFTEAVKAQQRSRASRHVYERMEKGGSWETRITPPLHAFITTCRSFFLATANSEGQPYVQHRGGPPGFLRALDDRTL